MAKPTTIVINNFTGRLTRIINGDLNSGFAKFDTSYGYDPFTKPMNLTWASAPQEINGTSGHMALAGKVRFAGETDPTVYMVTQAGRLLKVQVSALDNPVANSVIGIHSVLAGGATYTYGASMEFFGNESKIYVGSDNRVNSINFDGTADTPLGNAANYFPNIYRALVPFAGKLFFNNKVTVGAVDSTGTINSSIIGISSLFALYSDINPVLPSADAIKDLDVSPDNNYMLIAASQTDYERIGDGNSPNRINTTPSPSKVLSWNGVENAITAATNLSTALVSALQSFLQSNHYFASDSLGALLANDTRKMLTLTNSKAPSPNAVGVNGSFLHWVAPERTTFAGDSTPRTVATMYYFGALDEESPPGLWRMFRRSAAGLPQGNVLQTPFNQLVSMRYSDLNASQSSVVTVSPGVHYFSMYQAGQGIVPGTVLNIWRWNNPPYSSDTFQLGVYETQTQLFSKRVGISQIRVYCEAPVANNGFQLDIVGTDGSVVSNGSFSWSFGQPIDRESRINFNPSVQTLYGFGIRITNTGSLANMTIKKIEIDISEEGR